MRAKNKRKPSRFPMWARALFWLTAIIVVIVLVVSFMGVTANSSWQQYVAELRARGEPVTFEDIEARRAIIPDEQNGALVLEALKERFEELKAPGVDRNVLIFGSRGTGDPFDGIPRWTIAPSKAFREEHRDLLDALAALRERPVGRLEVPPWKDPTVFFEAFFPSLSQLRAAGRLAYLETVLSLCEGDMDRAIDGIEIQGALSGVLHDHPMLVSALVQLAVDALMLSTVEIALRVDTMSPAGLRRVEEVIDTRLRSPTLLWALRGERAFAVAIFDTAVKNPAQVRDMLPALPATWWPRWLIRANQIEMVASLSSMIDAGDDPRALVKAAGELEEKSQRFAFSRLFAKTALSSIGSFINYHQKHLAMLRTTKAALAAERYRLDTGRLPDALDVLVPDYLDDMLLDPFDGKPLRLTTTERGIVIYSIGENLTDNGGVVARTDEFPYRPPDEGFRLLRPEHRELIVIDLPEEEEPDEGDSTPRHEGFPQG